MQFEEPQKINILIVDDNPTNLLALEAILDAPDRNLVRAASGTEALRHLLDTDFAVLLLDVYMPVMDGLETAELIRGREKSRDIPIIFLTADSTGGAHISRGYSLGAVDYILKPIEPDILRSKVAVFVELFKKTWQVKQQAALLHEKNIELENANLQRLQMLIELGQQLAAERDPVRLLEKFCHAAQDIIGSECAAVGVLGMDGQTLQHFLSSGSMKDGIENSHAACAGIPQAHEGILGRMLKERCPLRVRDVGTSAAAAKDLPAHRAPKHSFLGAPILLPSQTYGWLYLSDKVGADEFSEADERLAVTLTSQVAVAYENASLYAESQRHTVALSQEVAERKQAEEERARLLVLEQEARAEAEAANRTKDVFLAPLSHELRTPLTSILGWIHLIRGGNLDASSASRALETIERNAKSQSQLIDDLLDVSRIITGKLHINIHSINFAAIIEAAVELVRPAAEAKNIELHTEIEPAATDVSGDQVRLQQVVWNLLANAVKFTPAGGRVYVSLKRADASVELKVKDSGMGISSDFLPHIFDRFRQADGTTTRSHGGLGLGLAIVRHLVELHHGSVEATSDGDGQGSEFTVTLPPSAVRFNSNMAGDDGALLSQATGSDSNSPDASAALYGLRILVVDDEPDAREVVAAVLRHSGAEVKLSGSAAEALDEINSWQPDLLVSDIGMPGEDGYSLIKKIRALDTAQRDITALALTAYASLEDRTRVHAAGFQMHVAKPVEPLQLVEAIARLAGRNGKI